VDLGDLKGEKESLSSFLHSKLKVDIVPVENKLVVDSERIPAQELQRLVIKFVYHRNLNNTHWASLEGKTVKINTFKAGKKKPEKNKNAVTASTIKMGW
jgi:hypothetical protein